MRRQAEEDGEHMSRRRKRIGEDGVNAVEGGNNSRRNGAMVLV